LKYIDARTARRRLNEVLGPAGWSCTVRPFDGGCVCALTIALPDGRLITREAVGGDAIMPGGTDEDRLKSGDSDAFKGACVLFGVAEYLYDQSAPAGRSWRAPQPTAVGGNGSADSPQANPEPERPNLRDGRDLFRWAQQMGKVDQVARFGRQHNFPRLIVDWSPMQVTMILRDIEREMAG
jgi:hypothetical protein